MSAKLHPTRREVLGSKAEQRLWQVHNEDVGMMDRRQDENAKRLGSMPTQEENEGCATVQDVVKREGSTR